MVKSVKLIKEWLRGMGEVSVVNHVYIRLMI